MTPRFVIEPLAAHGRLSFSCGVEALDRYLQTQAGQDTRRRVSNCFVAVPEGGTAIAGYYTLAASSLQLGELAASHAKKLPRYPMLPSALVGRLAVDRQFTRAGLGTAMLSDAILRAARAEPAVYAIVVDAKDDTAADFYRRLGFAGFTSRPLSFYLPLATAAQALLRRS